MRITPKLNNIAKGYNTSIKNKHRFFNDAATGI
ncbi:MAG: hypothetical protein JWP44_978 [Mucilaginibacter sp.]|nr:hypothetical protein [Mucilaginibacter sp.]